MAVCQDWARYQPRGPNCSGISEECRKTQQINRRSTETPLRSLMNTLIESQVRLFASSKSWIEGEAVRQLYATAKLDGVRRAVGFPDMHPGKGSPVGATFVMD